MLERPKLAEEGQGVDRGSRPSAREKERTLFGAKRRSERNRGGGLRMAHLSFVAIWREKCIFLKRPDQCEARFNVALQLVRRRDAPSDADPASRLGPLSTLASLPPFPVVAAFRFCLC